MCAERVVEGRQRAKTQPRSGASRRHRTVPPSLSQIGGASHKWEHSAHTGFPGVSLLGGGESQHQASFLSHPEMWSWKENRFAQRHTTHPEVALGQNICPLTSKDSIWDRARRRQKKPDFIMSVHKCIVVKPPLRSSFRISPSSQKVPCAHL